MNLQLVYQYILKWSKNENMFYQKRNKTKQKDQKEKKRKFPRVRVKPRTIDV